MTRWRMRSPRSAFSKAIGEPRLVQTKADRRCCVCYGKPNVEVLRCVRRVLRHGMAASSMRSFPFIGMRPKASRNSKQVLYLLGPVGSAKSTLAITLKSLMEQYPIYVLVDGDTGNAVRCSSPRSVCSIPWKFGAPHGRRVRDQPPVSHGPLQSVGAETYAAYHGTSPAFESSAFFPRCSINRPSRRLNRETRTTQDNQHPRRQGGHAQALQAEPRMIPTRTATPGGPVPDDAGTARVSSNVQKRRSRCCIPCSPPPRKATTRARKASAPCRTRARCSPFERERMEEVQQQSGQ